MTLVKKITERMQQTPLEPVPPASVTHEAALVVDIKRAGHLARHSREVAFPGGLGQSGDPHQLYIVLMKFPDQDMKAGLELNYDSN